RDYKVTGVQTCALPIFERGRLVYQDDRGLMDLPAPRLFGRHQFDNAGLAVATLRAQGAFRIDAAAFETGIFNTEWPARMQRLARSEERRVGKERSEQGW